MPKKTQHSPSITDVLTSICVAINATEGCEHMTEHEVKAVRDALYTVKNRIGTRTAYQTNKGLKTLDAAFTAAGWDNQGLRWTKERGDSKEDPQDIFVVEFTSPAHSRWFKP